MPGGSQNESPGGKRSYGKDTLRPVTIKQLIDAHHPSPDADHFVLDGSEMTQITFVGQIRNISKQTTNVTYKLDDGTGIIEVKEWVDSDALNDPEHPANNNNKKAELVEQGYARVWGRLKAFANKRTIGANIIRPVTDPNEIQYHLLEATAVHLHFTRGPVESLNANGGAGNDAMTNGHMSNGNTGGAGDLPAGTSAAARKVYACIQQTPQTNDGMHLSDISMRLQMEVAQVLNAAQELENSGKVFTTTDEHTWAIL